MVDSVTKIQGAPEVPALGGAQFVDDSDWVFAYQLGGGVAYRVAPGIDITAEYR